MQQISSTNGAVTVKSPDYSCRLGGAMVAKKASGLTLNGDTFSRTDDRPTQSLKGSPKFNEAMRISLAYTSGIKTVTDAAMPLESSSTAAALHGAGIVCNTAMALIALDGLKQGIEKKDDIKKIHSTATLSTSILRTIGNARQFGATAGAVTEGHTSSLLKGIGDAAGKAALLSKGLCLLSSGLFLTSGSKLICSGIEEKNTKKLMMGGVDLATSISAIGTLIPSVSIPSRIALMGALTARILVGKM